VHGVPALVLTGVLHGVPALVLAGVVWSVASQVPRSMMKINAALLFFVRKTMNHGEERSSILILKVINMMIS